MGRKGEVRHKTQHARPGLYFRWVIPFLFMQIAIRFVFCSLFGLSILVATPTVAQPGAARAGVYRTVADYRHRHFAPAGDDVRYSAKRNRFSVNTRRGSDNIKITVPRDSVWGYVDEQGRFYRTQGPDDFRVEQADTITVYSRMATLSTKDESGQMTTFGAGAGSNVSTAKRYYFSRGVNGRIYPLNDKYLRESFAAGSPAFVAALARRPNRQELSGFDRKRNAFYVAELFRSVQGK